MPVTSAAWAPDGESFITVSVHRQSPLCHWSIHGQRLYCWPEHYRSRDCAISPDGKRLVVISTEERIYVYNFQTRSEEYNISLGIDLASISISHDSKYMLVSTADEILLLGIEAAAVVRQYRGQRQGNFIIRSVFGGAAGSYVISGSEGSIPN